MNREPLRLLLGLVPPDEHAIEDVLYRSDELAVVASGADAAEVSSLTTAHQGAVVLVSPDLPGLDAAMVARLHATGARIAGLATSDFAATRLGSLDVDLILQPPVDGVSLAALLGDPSVPVPDAVGALPAAPQRRPGPRVEREGSVLAVVGSKGAPGASELAASFAAVVAREWKVLLAEFDGDGGQLALRLGADPREGSLLGLARAVNSQEPELEELLQHWLAPAGRGWPTVLLGLPDLPADLAETRNPGLIEGLLAVLGASFPLVVCDVGQRLRRSSEPDAAVRLHRDVLTAADAVVLVLGGRQEQLRSGFGQLELLLDDLGVAPERLRLVVNGQAGCSAPRTGETGVAISRELARHGLPVDAWLPWDEKSLRDSIRLGLPLAAARVKGAYAREVGELVAGVLLPSAPQPVTRKRRLRPLAPPAAPARPGELEEVMLPWRQ